MKKTSRADVLRMSWQFTRINGYDPSRAMKTAWLNARLMDAMSEGVVRFHFQKVDGTLREAWGTTKDSLVPPTKGTGRKPSPLVYVYFDKEKDEWRSYKLANLVSVG